MNDDYNRRKKNHYADQALRNIDDTYVFDSASGLYKPKSSDSEEKREPYRYSVTYERPIDISTRRDWIAIIISAATLVVLVVYTNYTSGIFNASQVSAVGTIESARAARDAADTANESLITVQRAFITFDHYEDQRGVKPGENNFFYDFTAYFQNSGVTPARIIGSSHLEIGERHEPTEEEFIGHPNLAPITLGPKTMQPFGGGRRDEDKIFGKSLGWRNENFGKDTHVHPFAIWAWMVYRDVFPNTDTHVTEFCEGMRDAYIKQGAMYFVSGSCGKHNCTDKDCEDYDEIVKLAREGEKKENCRHNPALCK